ncbi:peptidase domain-containing ABC transporter [Sinomicrobium oceani]|uniref:peptidase domain-containing ABC transporter n=1 Tax=Sinomicrobium oceani TaxID=1150368 RepID=UPI00227ABA12|nr:peptidase domain-containing ABC transporter [Sinomicrobium oceani]
MKKFPFYKQVDFKDCGPTCLKMIVEYYGKKLSIDYLRSLSETNRGGTNLKKLSRAAEKIGFDTIGVKLNPEFLEKAPLPCILFWKNNHYVVLYKVLNNTYYIADPAVGLIEYEKDLLIKYWANVKGNNNSQEGIVLLLEKSTGFDSLKPEALPKKLGYKHLLPYILKYKSLFLQLFIGLVAGSLLQLIFPFLTQSIVDVGIKNESVQLIYLILLAQLFIFLGKVALELIKGWALLHLSTRINILLISDFFKKLMSLPISFFDTKITGDILQRIDDHSRIEKLITTSSLSILFSISSILIFASVIAFYDFYVFLLFAVGSIVYVIWILFFLKKRKLIDHEKFGLMSQEQSLVVELLNGMQTIKMNNIEKEQRWAWENKRVELYGALVKGTRLEQTQDAGAALINELKNILITFYSALLVIEGDMTIGAMLAISYIIGSLNAPLHDFVGFVKEAQDAKLSLERLSEIQNKPSEIDNGETKQLSKSSLDIRIKNLNFRYPGSETLILKNINLIIPQLKTTAIVGASGSGKTTLLKILLRFYSPNEGTISIGDLTLDDLDLKAWRDYCGVVLQEDFIFNDTILKNVVVSDREPDKEQFLNAIEMANIKDFIMNLPQGWDTVIGKEGVGLSTGQKQRILLARAIYKSPEFLILDEATSALDADNEKVIVDNLENFFKKRTVLVVAHRLSTVKNADQIIVLENGTIKEIGTHVELVQERGRYYNLIKNQLELGN